MTRQFLAGLFFLCLFGTPFTTYKLPITNVVTKYEEERSSPKMAVNIVKDELSFPHADNPIVQFKDAMAIQNNITDFNSREDLETILNGSLYRLSVSEFASFVKFDPLFKLYSDKDTYNSMLLMSLFGQIKYVKSCLPDIEYKLDSWMKSNQTSNIQSPLKNMSPFFTHGELETFEQYGDARIVANFHTFSSNRAHGLSLAEAIQLVDFYRKHYNVVEFSIYNQNDKNIGVFQAPSNFINKLILEPNKHFKLKIDYYVESKKLPILVHHELQDCAQKALQFAQAIIHKNKSVNGDIIEDMIINLIDIYAANFTASNDIRTNISNIQKDNINFAHTSNEQQSASSRNELLNQMLMMANENPIGH